MIESIKIENYQSHKLTELEFSDGVNVVIGSSDTGKSAILRALNWVISNKPSGDEFHSHWSDHTKVTLQIDDTVIIREKGNGINQYELDGEIYKAFGVGVPTEIVKFVNMSNVNLQPQLAKHFLFSNTSGEVVRYLNKIVNLDVIDRSLSNIEKERRKQNNNLDNEKNNLETNQKFSLQFDWLDSAEQSLEKLEKKYQKLNSKKSSLLTLKSIIKDTNEVNTKIKTIDKFIKAEKKVGKLFELLTNIKDKKEKLNAIESIVDDLKEVRTSIVEHRETIKKLEKEYHKLMPNNCPLCGRSS